MGTHSNTDKSELETKVTEIVAMIPMDTGAKLTEIGWEKYGENEQDGIQKLVALIEQRCKEARINLDTMPAFTSVTKQENGKYVCSYPIPDSLLEDNYYIEGDTFEEAARNGLSHFETENLLRIGERIEERKRHKDQAKETEKE